MHFTKTVTLIFSFILSWFLDENTVYVVLGLQWQLRPEFPSPKAIKHAITWSHYLATAILAVLVVDMWIVKQKVARIQVRSGLRGRPGKSACGWGNQWGAGISHTWVTAMDNWHGGVSLPRVTESWHRFQLAQINQKGNITKYTSL